MEESVEPTSAPLTSPPPQKSAPVVVIIVAAVVIGATSGIVIADRNSGSVLKNNVSGQLARALGYHTSPDTKPAIPALQSQPTTGPQEEKPTKVIPIGLSSLDAIRYYVQSGSAHMDFDLGSTNLVGTGVLDSPDRIYIDLQESHGVQGEVGRLKTQKAIRIDGDPVARVRIAQREAGALRIVLDLCRSCDLKYEILPGPPARLILEVRPRATSASLSKQEPPGTRAASPPLGRKST